MLHLIILAYMRIIKFNIWKMCTQRTENIFPTLRPDNLRFGKSSWNMSVCVRICTEMRSSDENLFC